MALVVFIVVDRFAAFAALIHGLDFNRAVLREELDFLGESDVLFD